MELSKASGLEHYVFFKAIDLDGGKYGVGILSKYPIISNEIIRLESWDKEARVLGHAVIDVNGKEVDFFVTHLSYEDDELNAIQTRTVIEELQKVKNPFVLVGDFNTEDFSSFLEADIGAVNNPSFKVPTFDRSTIDNIFYSKNFFEFKLPKSLVNGHSDHNMLWAEAKFK